MNSTPEAAPLDPVHHVALSVRDIAESVAWYTKTFRCRVVHQDPTWAFLAFENLRLALVLPEQHPAHLALTRADAASFGPLTTHRDGTRSTYVTDPSGNSVEILAAD